MAVPETDLARTVRCCDSTTPAEPRDQIRVECRPPWHEALGPERTDNPQARLKYDDATHGWTLYCFDRSSKAHRYDLIDADLPVERVLREADDDPTAIFWGSPVLRAP